MQDNLGAYSAMVVGCGLGQENETSEFVRRLLLDNAALTNFPLIVDADALNALAGVPQWWAKMKASAVLTPHPGEMARLAGESTD
ncbi:MAG: NAD(P)H-hydrate dehydratase, partial [Dehalococcoidales bacterium]|nr:NAD(P)H-hydrate dehydratase [Dehalococcoidales bacterium]